MRAYETITMSYTPDADTFQSAANQTLVLADRVTQSCPGGASNSSVGQDQVHLCEAAFSALSLNDTRKNVWEFSKAVKNSDWSGVTKSTTAFDDHVTRHWPQFAENIMRLDGEENQSAIMMQRFSERAKRTVCSLYVAQAETTFLTVPTDEASDHRKAKRAYWSAMANAGEFLGQPDECEAEDDVHTCNRKKTAAISETCL